MTDHSLSALPEGADCGLVTRRHFVAGLGATVAVVLAGVHGISIWGRNPHLALAAPPPGSFGPGAPGRTLVVVEMGGGNDGLNMVVPHAAGAYRDLRGELAVADPIDLDGEIGLHPALESLAARYRRNEVAIVEGVGYPDPDLSHFASMSTWWTGTPGAVGATGWLGRYLDGTVGATDPLAAITIGPGPSAAMVGDASFVVSIQDATGLAPRIPPWIDDMDELLGAWAGFAAAPVDSPALFGQVQRAIAATAAARERLGTALAGPAAAPLTDAPAGDARMDRRRRRPGTLAGSLDVAARLVTSGLAPRIVYVHGFGDFDTHQGQVGRHETLMADLDEAVDGFFTSVEAAGRAKDVVVMTTSEFGRRARSNGSGTDHGTASTHLLIGATVRGGRHGAPPDLGALQDGNLVHTVDYRSLYATVLTGWLGAAAADVLGADHETLPLFATRDRLPIGPR